jgi:hypothetical protein
MSRKLLLSVGSVAFRIRDDLELLQKLKGFEWHTPAFAGLHTGPAVLPKVPAEEHALCVPSPAAWPTLGHAMACQYERRGGEAATQAPVTRALLPVSFYRTAHAGAASRTARTGCATMAPPAMTGHGREEV